MSTGLRGITSQKSVIFKLATMMTSHVAIFLQSVPASRSCGGVKWIELAHLSSGRSLWL